MAFKAYYRLTKPGIVYGNLLMAIAGFFLASHRPVKWALFVETMVGLALVIASACVFNNYLDRGLDSRMSRTKKRALVAGQIQATAALVYGSVLGIVGFSILIVFTNWLVVWLNAAAVIFYVVIYGVAKRRTEWGTLVGALPGAAPPLIGYCALSNQLDGTALILFLIMVFWQMPHFFAIAIRRADEYQAAGLPVLPVKKGARPAKIQSIVYLVGFLGAVTALRLYHGAGNAFLTVIGALGLWWLVLGLKGFGIKDDKLWAKRMFMFSLWVLLSMSVMLSLNNLL